MTALLIGGGKKKVELVILKKRGFLSLLSYIWTNELEFDFCFF